jgi:hypothetical protein
LAAFLPCVDGAVDPRHHHLSANIKSSCQKGVLAQGIRLTVPSPIPSSWRIKVEERTFRPTLKLSSLRVG